MHEEDQLVELNKQLNRKLALASLLVLIAVLTVVVGRLTGCGAQPTQRQETVQEPAPLPPPGPTPPPPPTTKPSCDTVTTFAQLRPIISLNCAGCHPQRDTYDKAKATFDEMDRRIKITQASGDSAHMPAQRPDLAPKDVAVFDAWKASGFLNDGDCGQGTPDPTKPATQFHPFTEAEDAMFAAASSQPISAQQDVRFLVAQDQLNLGNAAGVAIARAAATKATNSVSLKRDPQAVYNVAPGIWRIDIDELGISAADWTAIEDASLVQFESFTQRGLALKNITHSRLPWLSVGEFNDVVMRNATIYYRLTHAPATLQQLFTNLGVNFSGDLAQQKASLVGFNHSSLSPAANRLMARFDSNDGFFWATFDTGPIVSQAQNLFANPLLVQAGGQHNLKFAAGEQLYSLPNGLMGSFLADVNNNRLDFADPNVVHDFTTNPISPFIRNAVSCFRCHNGGIIHATDEVRAHIPAAQLGANDSQIALALFKPQASLDQQFNADNARFADAMKKLGLDPTAPDPISQVSDDWLGDWNLDKTAARVWLRPEELRACISLSPLGSLQLAQLLSGGSVGHDQFVQVSKQLQQDCRLFQDPLSE